MEKIRRIIYRNLLDFIFTLVKIEGLRTTRLETLNLVNHAINAGMSKKDERIIINMKNAYLFIAETIEYSGDRSYFLQLHSILSNGLVIKPGRYRTTSVSIGGSVYIPDMINEFEANDFIDKAIDKADNIYDIINLGVESMRKQYFEDVNKRTVFSFMNVLALRNKLGFITIVKEDDDSLFRDLLIKFYEKYDEESRKELVDFIKDRCYHEFVKMKEKEFKGPLVVVKGFNSYGFENIRSNKIIMYHENDKEAILEDQLVLLMLDENSDIAFNIRDNIIYNIESKQAIGYVY